MEMMYLLDAKSSFSETILGKPYLFFVEHQAQPSKKTTSYPILSVKLTANLRANTDEEECKSFLLSMDEGKLPLKTSHLFLIRLKFL